MTASQLTTQQEAKGRRTEKALAHPALLILGVGNVLLRDEGVGVRVVEAMEGIRLPDNVELLDGGTASVDLLDSLVDRDRVIIVDCVRGGGEPGTVYRLSPKDMAMQAQAITSLHQVGLLEALALAEGLGCAPREVTIFGIEPREISWGLELTPQVAAAVPGVIELVLRELPLN
ncbi:MAG: HyaD/HybD family hydrogenase maturation endopeptidase [Chloroflexota bacterium]